MTSNRIPLKVLLVGDSGVGKTTIRRKLVGLSADSKLESTIGIEVDYFKFNLDNIQLNFLLFDIGGQKHYSNLRSAYYDGSHLVMFVYDVTKPHTLFDLIDWMNEVKTSIKNYYTNYMLIGNKIDLEIKINEAHLKHLMMESERIGIKISDTLLVSAQTGEKINDLFKKIVKLSILSLINSRRKVKSIAFL